jgi:predicted DNA-binding transcriptional regulator YafY
MGTRDNYETVTRVMQAFVAQRTWQQAELARHVEVQPRALRSLLTSLLQSGMPLDKEEEHPHVYWSVPPHWFPGGVIFDMDDWQVLVHAVLRIADPVRQQKLLTRLLSGRRSVALAATGVERLKLAVTAAPLASEEHEKVLLIEQSVLEGVPLAIHYYSANRGQLSWRVISPQRVFTEPHGRVSAYCHVNHALRWFRIDNIQQVRLERNETRKDVPLAELDAFLASSVDGYNDGTDEPLRFQVRSPECAWVRGNLLAGMAIEQDAHGDGITIVAHGAALVVARYVVGLGGAARAESASLKGLVKQLAEAAIEANS